MAVSGSGGWLRLADQTTPTRRAGTTTVPREPLPDHHSLYYCSVIPAIAAIAVVDAVIAAANVNNIADADTVAVTVAVVIANVVTARRSNDNNSNNNNSSNSNNSSIVKASCTLTMHHFAHPFREAAFASASASAAAVAAACCCCCCCFDDAPKAESVKYLTNNQTIPTLRDSIDLIVMGNNRLVDMLLSKSQASVLIKNQKLIKFNKEARDNDTLPRCCSPLLSSSLPRVLRVCPFQPERRFHEESYAIYRSRRMVPMYVGRAIAEVQRHLIFRRVCSALEMESGEEGDREEKEGVDNIDRRGTQTKRQPLVANFDALSIRFLLRVNITIFGYPN
ncbi:hypothetical protein V1478_006265 [Vespula squamosa]|uniref:Uncharacterized protein n=1 Tax=Vespula squamosa TaxID=30214 RepID=A0ABD2B7D7_VESSQ